jgi:hypothetical protein
VWIGETLGQANAREETTRHVPDGSYSLGIVIGYQKDTAQDLLKDAAPGTPQRFLWCAATDPTVPDIAPEHPGFLKDVGIEAEETETVFATLRTGTIRFDEEINDELWAREPVQGPRRGRRR